MTRESFEALQPVFQPLVDQLKAKAPALPSDLPERKGIYLLSENGVDLYIGITGNLRRCWRMHRSGDANGASFAVRLAREMTGRRPTYSQSDGLKALLNDDEFRQAFATAKARIRGMQVRFIEWTRDDDDLALFEIYAASALRTSAYNDFATH
jgi:predicted GIY-YIG superfamily endonuclease